MKNINKKGVQNEHLSRKENEMLTQKEILNTVWKYDHRNTSKRILSDYFNGFRLILKPYMTGYKFYVAIRRYERHGIDDYLLRESPVAYFGGCSLEKAKIKAYEHFIWMNS